MLIHLKITLPCGLFMVNLFFSEYSFYKEKLTGTDMYVLNAGTNYQKLPILMVVGFVFLPKFIQIFWVLFAFTLNNGNIILIFLLV